MLRTPAIETYYNRFEKNKLCHPLSEVNIMIKNEFKSKYKINKIGITNDTNWQRWDGTVVACHKFGGDGLLI